MEKQLFGKMKDEKTVYLFTLENGNGLQLKVMNFGASIVSLKVPDRNNVFEHVVLGYPELKTYQDLRHYFGAIVGRYGNRIANGEFTLAGKHYSLAVNEGANHVHGGNMGFDRLFWESEIIKDRQGESIQFSYLSPDGEEGYPGNLTVQVRYSLTDDNELKIDYVLKTDKLTVKNVTNHAYFNLSGNAKTDILNHELLLNADYFLPVKPDLIPTGEKMAVKDTPMDFRTPHKIGERIDIHFEQLKMGPGYDHNWIINKASDKINYAGYVYEPESGRKMDIFTTEPGIQFYSGNFLDGTDLGHDGVLYQYRDAMCLETQHFPDSPNHPEFPTSELQPGETYKSTTIYKFTVS